MKLSFFFIFLILMATLTTAAVNIGEDNTAVRGVNIISPEVVTPSITDTNATTACSGAQVLLGNGSCGLAGAGGGDFSFTDFQNSYGLNLTNIFDQDLNTTSNVSFGNVTSSSWFNGLFNWIINTGNVSTLYLTFNGSTLFFDETQLNTTIDDRLIANETNRFQNLTTYSCSGTDKVTGVQLNGTVICGSDGGGGNIFDQDLNTSNSPSFSNLTVLGNLTVDTNTLIVDSGNNRVGIGTLSPGGTLEVQAATAQIIINASSTGDADPAIIFQTDAEEKARVLYDESLAQLSLFVNGGHRLVVEDGGNVGIGTFAPEELLNVFGTDVSIISEGDGVTRAGFKIKTNNVLRWDINSPSAQARLAFIDGSDNEVLTLEQLGNVGIGTSTPDYLLEVNGNSSFNKTLLCLFLPYHYQNQQRMLENQLLNSLMCLNSLIGSQSFDLRQCLKQ